MPGQTSQHKPDKGPRRKFLALRLLILGPLGAAVFIAGLLTAAGFGAAWHRLFEIAASFRVLYAVGLGVAAMVFLLARHLRLCVLSVLFALVNAAVLLGDLNCVSWSPPLRRVCREGRMKDARKGFGVCATWPARIALLGCPIHHCLVSPEIHVRDFRTGADLGSDHLPIVVDFAIPRESSSPHGTRPRGTAGDSSPESAG